MNDFPLSKKEITYSLHELILILYFITANASGRVYGSVASPEEFGSGGARATISSGRGNFQVRTSKEIHIIVLYISIDIYKVKRLSVCPPPRFLPSIYTRKKRSIFSLAKYLFIVLQLLIFSLILNR